MRKFLIAMFATVALPAMASAQDDDRGDDRARFRAERADAPRERNRPTEPRADSGDSGRAQRREYRENRPAPTPQVAVDAQGSARIDRGRGVDRPRFQPPPAAPAQAAPVQAQPQARGDWRRNGNDGARNGNNGQRRDWDRNGNDGQRRDGDRNGNNGQRRDWDRNGNDGQRRDWNGDNNGRSGWDRDRDWRDGNRNNNRSWDRGWRNNNRYDWQRYRSGNRNAFRLPRYTAPYSWHYGYRRQSIGAYLFTSLFAQNYWINDPWQYRLPPVYWPYQWVRYYDDALLVDTRSGYVVDVIPEIFWY